MSAGLIAGVLVLGAGAPPEAVAPAVPETHKDALARYGVGVWQAHRDRLLSAARALETAAKDDPESTAALKELVRVYAQIGREPDAIRVGRLVLAKDPADADTAHALARLLSDAGEPADAVAYARMAADAVDADDRPDKALAVYRDLATLLDKAADPAGAADALRKGIALLTTRRKAVLASGAFGPKEIDATAADTFERLGRVLVKQGKPGPAAEAFRAAHALYADPLKANDPGAAARLDWNLSAAEAARGDPAAALVHLEAFLKLRPQAVEPFERLVTILNQAGRAADVVPALRRHAARDPKNHALAAVLAAELARDPDTRAEGDAAFAQLYPLTNDPRVVRVALRSHVETGRPARVVADLDRAYADLKENGDEPAAPKPADRRAFAAEKARVIADVLRAEPRWAEAVLGAVSGPGGRAAAHQTWHVLGVLADRHHQLDLAANQFRDLAHHGPQDVRGEAYQQWIAVLLQDRKPAAVESVCREGLTAAGLSPAFFNFYLSYALAELGRADEAVAAADKAVEQAPGTDGLTYRLRKAAVLKAVGRWDEAIAYCKKQLAEADAPADRVRVRYALAAAYWGARKRVEAEAELRAILDADPDHAGACNDLGYHLAEQGRDLAEAERLVRHAVAVDRADRRKVGDPEPENAAYLDSLGWVLFRKGDLAAARDLLAKAAALPDGVHDPVVWDHLGDVRFRLGEKDRAKAAWETAAGLYTTDARGKRDGLLDEVRRKLKRTP